VSSSPDQRMPNLPQTQSIQHPENQKRVRGRRKSNTKRIASITGSRRGERGEKKKRKEAIGTCHSFFSLCCFFVLILDREWPRARHRQRRIEAHVRVEGQVLQDLRGQFSSSPSLSHGIIKLRSLSLSLSFPSRLFSLTYALSVSFSLTYAEISCMVSSWGTNPVMSELVNRTRFAVDGIRL